MPAALPAGETVPADGALPRSALTRLRRDQADGDVAAPPRRDRFGVYVHVPYCATRCGYCDFNTYTPAELGIGDSGKSELDTRSGPHSQSGSDVDSYLTAVLAEVEHAAAVLDPSGGAGLPTIDTVFFGGGTPTLLPAGHLAAIVRRLHRVFGLAADAELSTEANPESVDSAGLSALVAARVTRISLGMQSASTGVLATLDRRHTPGRAIAAVGEARGAGFSHVNLDLIYGTPGETEPDWRASLSPALAADVDHVSAYALTVEPGTQLARRVGKGSLAPPDDDVLADRYQMAEQMLGAAGFEWYEISNWARPGEQCLHNLLYWGGGEYQGVGCAAHSHRDGRRSWNVRTPDRYIDAVEHGRSVEAGAERLGEPERRLEALQLSLRTVCGVPAAALPLDDLGDLGDLVAVDGDRAVLTVAGRPLANEVPLRLRVP